MPSAGPHSERVLVLAPTGRDGEVARLLLHHAGYFGVVCSDLTSLCDEIERGVGVVLLAEESTTTADMRRLSGLLGQQEPWSDLPFIVLTRHGGGPERNPAATRLAEILGNVTFLERPFHPTTLASVVGTALRGRRRQYEARARLAELNVEKAALSDLTETLEWRVEKRTAELFTAQAQLLQSQKVESLGHLTGGVAHDFNNLLMAVMGNLDLLRKRVLDDERAQRLIDGALQGARRGAALTQRMLGFARQQELKTEPVDLAQLLADMRGLIERAVSPAVEVRFEITPGLPPAQVDANQVELAVLNLCINARDAMPDGGTITVGLDARAAEGDLAPGSYLCVYVSDPGTGMDEDTLKKAVEPFFSTKPTGKGTGLGLSTVHGLAVQLGGCLDLRSELNEGTVATLWLPEAKQAAETLENVAPSFPREVRRGTILVVDDDPLIAMSTVDMLQDLGHTVIEANSGQRALEIIETGQPIDLLMTDHVMPGMTGLELAEIVRTQRPALPVLLATGYADLPQDRALDLPRLSKPYELAQLQEQINRLLSK